jgi:hypothetical protein
MYTQRRTWRSLFTPVFLAICLVLSMAGPAAAAPDGPEVVWPPTWPPVDQVFPIVKTDAADPVPVTGEVNYSITVGNLRPDDGTLPPFIWAEMTWTILDILPAGLNYVSADPPAIYDAGQHMLKWELGNVPVGSYRTVNVTLQPDPAVILVTTEVTNQAQLWLSWWGAPPGNTPQGHPPFIQRHMINETSETTTITVGDLPPLVPYTLLLQQGKDNYAGNVDTYLDHNNPNSNYGSAAWMYLKTVDSATVLSRWDLTGLPAEAQITSAKLRFYIGATNPLNVPITLQLHNLLRPWDVGRATWLYATSALWGAPGANGAGDRTFTPDALLSCYRPAMCWLVGATATAPAAPMLEFDITALAQAWAANPDANMGVIIKAAICQGTATYRLFSANWPLQERRPELYLEYLAAPTP